MAVRAEEPKVFHPVVEPLAVAVIDDQAQWPPLPFGAATALFATLGDAHLDKGTPQATGRYAIGAGGTNAKNLFRWQSSAGWPSALMRLPQEVTRIEAGRLDSSGDVGVRSTGQLNAELAHDARDRR
jgi:hypothetical protein